MEPHGSVWLVFSAVATVSVTPVLLSIPFFGNHFAIKPETFTIWYFASVALGVALWLSLAGRGGDLAPTGPGAALGIVLVGLTCGAAANAFLFRAVSLAPNPGLPSVMYSGASAIVFVCSAVLADRFPRLFAQVNTDVDRFVGILLVITGVFLISGGWPSVRSALTR